MQEITSSQNQVFKNAKQLTQKKYREKQNRYLLEGLRYIQTAIELGHECHMLFCLKGHEHEIQGIHTYVLSKELFDALSGTENSQGLIGVFEMTPVPHLDDIGIQSGHVLFLDRIQDPGNLGTMIRTADASGIKTIIMAKGTVDIYNDKVVRSAAGSLLSVNCLYVDDAVMALNALKTKGFHVIVTALEGAVDYGLYSNYKSSNCLVIGNEANGVSKEIIAIADTVVKIPILGKAESLNASVAAGIMMYKMKEF